MYKVSDFSKICGLSIDTIKHYETIGLLHPSYVDDINNYRFYAATKIVEVQKIQMLKDAGCSLKEIKDHLDSNITATELTSLLQQKIEVMSKKIEQLKEQYNRLEVNYFILNNGGMTFMNQIVVKEVEPIWVVSKREVYDEAKETFDAFCERMWNSLNQVVQEPRTISCMSIYYAGLFVHTEKPIDMEVIEPLASKKDGNDIRLLPKAKVASIIHVGPLNTIGESYQLLLTWMKEHKYEINGGVREIYHEGEWSKDTDQYVTELQVPISINS